MSIRIEHRIGVAASPEMVWEVIADFERWSEWNSLHPEVRGVIAIGGRLEVAEVLDGEPGRLHQVVAEKSAEVYFVAAGLPLKMKG